MFQLACRPALAAAALIALLSGMPALAQDTFTYTYGDYTAELPTNPQRVFVMDSRTGLDFAVSAGFPIVATDWDSDTDSHFTDDIPADADKLTFRNEPNAELVLTYEPDLLVVGAGWWNYWKEQALFNAGDIPVLVVQDGSGGEWRDLFAGQMAAYNRKDRADELLAAYDAAVAAAKPQIERVLGGRQVAITDVWGADQVAVQINTFPTSVAHDLGLNLLVPEGGEATDDGYMLFSAENLGVFDDAALLMSLWTTDIAANPMWQRIPAVTHGAQYEMDIANSWGFALTATDFVGDVLEAVAQVEKADAQ